MPETDGLHPECVIEAADAVFPRGQGDQLDQLVGAELRPRPREGRIVDRLRRRCQGVGQRQRRALPLAVVGALRITVEVQQLLVAEARLAAAGSVQIRSVGASDGHGDAPVDEVAQRPLQQSRLREAGEQAAPGAGHRRPARQQAGGADGVAMLRDLAAQTLRELGVGDLVGVHIRYARHESRPPSLIIFVRGLRRKGSVQDGDAHHRLRAGRAASIGGAG